MADPVSTVLGLLLGTPMRGQQMLPGLFDPTGQAFQHDGQTSTELNMITGDPGNYRMIPSLTPNQVDIQNLIAGMPPSQQQMGRAGDYAASRSSEVPQFKTIQDALAYEQQRHQGLDQGYRPINQNDLLSWLLMAISGAKNEH